MGTATIFVEMKQFLKTVGSNRRIVGGSCRFVQKTVELARRNRWKESKLRNPRAQKSFKSCNVDMMSKRLNSLKTYLSRFWDYYQSSPVLQQSLSNN